MELVKIINKKKTYTDKKGVVRASTHLYIVAELDGKRVCVSVKPSFPDSKRDYFILDTLAKTEIINQ